MDGGEPPPVHGCSEAAAGPSGALALIHAVPTAGATALGASGPTGAPGGEVMAAGAPRGQATAADDLPQRTLATML